MPLKGRFPSRRLDEINLLTKQFNFFSKILDKVKYLVYDTGMAGDQEFVDKIRKFNRFYTNIIGLLDQHFLDTHFSLTEGRVLYEIHHMDECSARKIREHIAIDEGYLSRIIDKFIKKGLITKTPSPQDRRLHIIVLTKKGELEFAKLNENQNKLISQIAEALTEQERTDLVQMMERIEALLHQEERKKLP